MPHDVPRRENSNSPEREVHVNTTMLRENGECLQAIAEGLPSTFSAAQKPRVPNDESLIVPGEVLHNKISEVRRLLALPVHRLERPANLDSTPGGGGRDVMVLTGRDSSIENQW